MPIDFTDMTKQTDKQNATQTITAYKSLLGAVVTLDKLGLDTKCVNTGIVLFANWLLGTLDENTREVALKALNEGIVKPEDFLKRLNELLSEPEES